MKRFALWFALLLLSLAPTLAGAQGSPDIMWSQGIGVLAYRNIRYDKAGLRYIASDYLAVHVHNTGADGHSLPDSIVRTLDAGEPYYSADISPDGTLVAILTATKVTLRSVADGSTLWSQSATGPGRDVQFSPDGAFVTYNDNQNSSWQVLLRAADGIELNRWSYVDTSVFSPDSQYLLIRQRTGGGFTLYRLSNLTAAYVWTGIAYNVAEGALCFSPDGSRVVTLDTQHNDRLIIRRATDGAFLGGAYLPYNNQFPLLKENIWGYLATRFAPDGTTLYIAGNYSSKLTGVGAWIGAFSATWDTNNLNLFPMVNHELLRIVDNAGFPFSVGISPDTKQVMIGGGQYDGSLNRGAGFLSKYNTSDFSTPASVGGHGWIVNSVAYAPNGQFLASGSGDGTVILWNVDGTLKGRFYHGSEISTVAISPDSALVATAAGSLTGRGDGSIKIWRVSDGTLVRTISRPGVNCYCLAFSPDGTTLAAGYEYQYPNPGLSLYSVADGSLINGLPGGPYFALSYSPDGSRISTAGAVYDAHTLALIADCKYGGHTVAFSPDGKSLAIVNGGVSIQICNTTTGAVLQTIQAHDKRILGLAFSPDGKYLLSGGEDAKLRIWKLSDSSLAQDYDMETGIPGAWAGGGNGVRSVAYSPSGQYLAYAAGEGPVVLAKNPFWNAPAPNVNDQSVSLKQNGSLAITLTATDTTGTAVTFAIAASPAHGTLSGAGANLTYAPNAGYFGADSFTFTAKNGYGIVSQPATVSINVMERVKTTLTLKPLKNAYATPFHISANLQDKDGTPLANKSLTLAIDGVIVGSNTTNAVGKTSIEVPNPAQYAVGKHPISVAFSGDSDYQAAPTVSSVLTITKADSSLQLKTASGYLGQKATLSATLKRKTDKAALSGQTVTFKVDGVVAGQGITNASGVATFLYLIDEPLASGDHALTAEYAGDSSDNASIGSSTLTVKVTPTLLKASSLSGKRGRTVNLTGALKRSTDGKYLSGRAITFSIDGVVVGTANTDTNGVVTLSYPIAATLEVGKHTILIVFDGDGYYRANNANATLTVK